MLSIRTQDKMALVPYKAVFIPKYPAFGEKYSILADSASLFLYQLINQPVRLLSSSVVITLFHLYFTRSPLC